MKFGWQVPIAATLGSYYWWRDYSADMVTHWMPLPDLPPVDEKEGQTMEDKFFETLDRLGIKVPDEAKESEEQKATWRIRVYLYNGDKFNLECSEAQRKAFVERFSAVDDEAVVPAEHSGGVAYVKKGDVIFLNVEPETDNH